eukprot:6060331-Amphidinium_carterae.1
MSVWCTRRRGRCKADCCCETQKQLRKGATRFRNLKISLIIEAHSKFLCDSLWCCTLLDSACRTTSIPLCQQFAVQRCAEYLSCGTVRQLDAWTLWLREDVCFRAFDLLSQSSGMVTGDLRGTEETEHLQEQARKPTVAQQDFGTSSRLKLGELFPLTLGSFLTWERCGLWICANYLLRLSGLALSKFLLGDQGVGATCRCASIEFVVDKLDKTNLR